MRDKNWHFLSWIGTVKSAIPFKSLLCIFNVMILLISQFYRSFKMVYSRPRLCNAIPSLSFVSTFKVLTVSVHMVQLSYLMDHDFPTGWANYITVSHKDPSCDLWMKIRGCLGWLFIKRKEEKYIESDVESGHKRIWYEINLTVESSLMYFI